MNAAVIVRCSGSLRSSRTCCARRDRDAAGDVDLADIADLGGALARHVGRRGEQTRRPLRPADAAGIETRGHNRAQGDLARIGDTLHGDRFRDSGPRDEEFTVHASGHHELKGPRRDPHRHAQRDRRPSSLEPPDTAEHALHLPGGATRALLVAVAVEEKKERISTPLEQACAEVVRLVEQSDEDVVERVPHQLRADLAASRKVLRERREPGDVDEHHRPLDLPVQGVRRLPQPVDDETRDVRRQHLV